MKCHKILVIKNSKQQLIFFLLLQALNNDYKHIATYIYYLVPIDVITKLKAEPKLHYRKIQPLLSASLKFRYQVAPLSNINFFPNRTLYTLFVQFCPISGVIHPLWIYKTKKGHFSSFHFFHNADMICSIQFSVLCVILSTNVYRQKFRILWPISCTSELQAKVNCRLKRE